MLQNESLADRLVFRRPRRARFHIGLPLALIRDHVDSITRKQSRRRGAQQLVAAGPTNRRRIPRDARSEADGRTGATALGSGRADLSCHPPRARSEEIPETCCERHVHSRSELVPWKRDPSRNSRAGHPGWRRCSSLKYSRYSHSSRLASRAPRSGTCASHHVSRGLALPEEGSLMDSLATLLGSYFERAQRMEERFELTRGQVSRTEAETANRMRDAFLATVSHELRRHRAQRQHPASAHRGAARFISGGHGSIRRHALAREPEHHPRERRRRRPTRRGRPNHSAQSSPNSSTG
jgi:hypothetical protein